MPSPESEAPRPHQWEFYEFAGGGVRGWHCTGCHKIHREREGPPPVDECPGKRPWTAQEAATLIRVYEHVGWELPEGFWETRGGRALREVLDAGAEAG